MFWIKLKHTYWPQQRTNYKSPIIKYTCPLHSYKHNHLNLFNFFFIITVLPCSLPNLQLMWQGIQTVLNLSHSEFLQNFSNPSLLIEFNIFAYCNFLVQFHLGKALFSFSKLSLVKSSRVEKCELPSCSFSVIPIVFPQSSHTVTIKSLNHGASSEMFPYWLCALSSNDSEQKQTWFISTRANHFMRLIGPKAWKNCEKSYARERHNLILYCNWPSE